MKQIILSTLVYAEGTLYHLPGRNSGAPYTRCGLDAGLMERGMRPITIETRWCEECAAIRAREPIETRSVTAPRREVS